MLCDLDMTVRKTCILRSPSISESTNWTCLSVFYELSSHDVNMTVAVLADNVTVRSYTLLANETVISIPNPNLVSSVSFQLEASRYLVTTNDYETALVTSVKFLPCIDRTGRKYIVISMYIIF